MLKKILICVLIVLVVAAAVIPVVAFRDRITKIKTDTSDKPDLPEDTEQPNDEDRLYTLTVGENITAGNLMINGDYVEPGFTLQAKEFFIGNSSAGEVIFFTHGKIGDHEWIVVEGGIGGDDIEGIRITMTEDITIVGELETGY